MTLRFLRRGLRALAFTTIALVAFVVAAPARAAAPACFPERTVSASIKLRDDRLQVFGGLRAGQIVQLRAEPTAASGDQAEIEIAEPIAVSGRTDRMHLVVFARQDLEVQPGLSWVLTGAPLAILSGDERTARVVVAPPLHGDEPQLPPVEVPCAVLQGTAPPGITGWDVVGPVQNGRDRVLGRAVEWDDSRVIESDAGARSIPLWGHSQLTDGRRSAPILIRVESARALVEVLDHYRWTRHRGWTALAGLRFQRRRRPDVICGCGAESGEWLRFAFPRKPAAQLRAATPLRSIADGRTVAILPSGGFVIPQMVDGDEGLVAWTDRAGRLDDLRILLFGRVPTSAMRSVSVTVVNAIVTGKVRASTAGTSMPDRLAVHARWGIGEVVFHAQTTVTKDGSFRLVSPVNGGKLEVWAEAPNELHLSPTEYVQLAAGKSSRVVLKLAPEERSPPHILAADARCPASFAKASGACDERVSAGVQACVYSEGTCSCVRSAPCSGVPSPAGEPRWRCRAARTDGCPNDAPAQDSLCATPGKTCSYGDCGSLAYSCDPRKRTWFISGGTAPPPGMPRGDVHPLPPPPGPPPASRVLPR